ncbi:galactose-3-O-sulfotransferase 2-like [Mytilus trossulus]|uniref:galactose-3-O-sulfotransferase 2-like n=1 Tax=Mytilus trossulus TaxID=6551 RepID=UPI0030076CBA
MPNELIENTCNKQRNVIFVKVHKTGSTTAWGIFTRFVQANNLNMVLPKRDNGSMFNYLSSKYLKLKETVLRLPKNMSYNILCNHAIYNKQDFEKIMPNDTVRIGILRDPLSVFKSAFYHFSFNKLVMRKFPNIKRSLLLHEFIVKKVYQQYAIGRSFTNGMSYDFGIPKSKTSNTSFVLEYIRELDKDFKLVIITELFDESLVLMRRYLCWDIQDILYQPVNKGIWRNTVKPNLTREDIDIVRNLNNADNLLYDFFKTRLENQITQQNDSFYTEVRHFKKIIASVHKFCRNIKKRSCTIEKSEWNSEFVMTRHFCDQLVTSELDVLRKMIKKAKRTLVQNNKIWET